MMQYLEQEQACTVTTSTLRAHHAKELHLFPETQAGCEFCGIPGQKPAVALVCCTGSRLEQERLKLLRPVLDLLSSAHAAPN